MAWRDWLQQICLVNILLPAQKYANDAKMAAGNIYFIVARLQ